jgi:KDO2-lipid IV(A) lauroyltransferase|tara:strand:- start:371 stop:1477 length:1107 start_codon:yes stop_codon:yes gene_type:complete
MKKFNSQVNNLKNRIFSDTNDRDDDYSKSFAFSSANLNSFLPSIESNKHKMFFKKCLFNQHLSSIEEDDFNTIDSLNIINNTSFNDIEKIKDLQTPTIFTTFHLGSYRILNSFLTKHGFNTTLIVDEEVYTAQKDSFIKGWEVVENYYKKKSSFTVLNAEKRSVLLTLIRLIKNNNVLIVYLDGNTGTGKKLNKNPNLIKIDFLKNTMFVRKGFAFLSNILKTNIVPVLSYRDNDKINLHFFKEMAHDTTLSREDSINQITNYNFENFEKYLLKYPEQWEGWFYMHKWFDLKSLKKQPYKKLYTLKNKTNFKRYIPFKYCVNQYFLLDKSDFNSYPISYKVYRGLWDNTINSIDSENKTELIKINAII